MSINAAREEPTTASISGRSVLLALLTSLLVLVLLAAGTRGLWLSSDRAIGVYLELTNEGIEVTELEPESPATRSEMQVGDRLETISGHPVPNFTEYDFAASTFARNREVPFVVDRDGRSVTLSVKPGTSFPWASWTLNTFAALSYLAIAVLVLVQFTADMRARLLALLAIAVALELALPETLIGFAGLDNATYYIFYLLTGIQLSLELHLVSVIPTARSWIWDRPWVIPSYYAMGIGLGTLLSVTSFLEDRGVEGLPWSLEQMETLLFDVVMPLWAVAVVAILASATFSRTLGSGRDQAGFVLLGILPWAVIILTLTAVTWAGAELPEWAGNLETLALLCFPLAVLAAIHRAGLFGLQLRLTPEIIHRFLLNAILAAVYGSVWIVGSLVSASIPGGLSIWIVAGVALLMGLAFAPIRALLQRFIARHFFPEGAAQRRRLSYLMRTLPACVDLPTMGEQLVTELRAILSSRSACLYLADPETGLFGNIASSSDSNGMPPQSNILQPNDPALRFLIREGRPVPARKFRAIDSQAAETLQDSSLDLVAPILGQESQLLGILTLGRKELGSLHSPDEVELVGLVADHAAMVLENARLFETATRDNLTGLLRREAILENLDREMKRADRIKGNLSVAMVDLDEFKRINDRYGHLNGDVALRSVARVMLGSLRKTDLVGRYGGEEFLIVLPETDILGALRVAEKVRLAVERTSVRGDGIDALELTLSMGVASLADLPSEPPPKALELLDAADRALFRAKAKGRNCIESMTATQETT